MSDHDRKPRTGIVTRLLGLFTRVEPGEGGTALLLALNLFLLLTAYYMLKTVREPLILMGGGAELKSYAAAGQALLLIWIVPLYGRFVDRTDRVTLIRRVTLFFALNLALFYALARLGVPYLGVVFFLWVGIFSLMIIAQAWSFANDLYTEAQGKRLFPLIAFGSSVGAIVGALAAGGLYDLGLGAFEMMLAAAVLLAVSAGIHGLVCRREGVCGGKATSGTVTVTPEPEPMDRTGGFQLVLRDRYLLLIGLLLLLVNVVNTTGEYILGAEVARSAADGAAGIADPAMRDAEVERTIGGFYSVFFTGVNTLSALLQLFAVSRVLRFAGVRTALFVLPIIALGGYAIIAAGASLAVLRIAKTLENATDYSLQNTVRQALFLPTSRAAKYKAKQAVDTFFVRAGDVASAGVVYLGTSLGLGTRHFALANIGFTVVWLLMAAAIGRRYRRLSEADS